MSKHENWNREAEGPFIYKDSNGRSVYRGLFMKDGYVIPNSEVRAYTIYSARYVLAVSIGALLYFFFDNAYVGIAVGLVVLAVLELLFRFKFLKGLRKIEGFERPKQDNFMERNVKSTSAGQLLISVLLSVAFVIALIYNFYVMKFRGFERIAYLVLVAGAIAYAIFNTYLLVRKQTIDRQNKK